MAALSQMAPPATLPASQTMLAQDQAMQPAAAVMASGVGDAKVQASLAQPTGAPAAAPTGGRAPGGRSRSPKRVAAAAVTGKLASASPDGMLDNVIAFVHPRRYQTSTPGPRQLGVLNRTSAWRLCLGIVAALLFSSVPGAAAAPTFSLAAVACPLGHTAGKVSARGRVYCKCFCTV